MVCAFSVSTLGIAASIFSITVSKPALSSISAILHMKLARGVTDWAQKLVRTSPPHFGKSTSVFAVVPFIT